jgi:pimeloyl-ACP methyl ester carboxylesterase
LAGRHPERFLSFTALSFGHSRAYTAAGFEQLRKAWYLFLFLVPGLPERIVPRNDWKMLREATRHAEVERWVADLARPGRFLAAMNLYRANVLSPESHPNLKMPVMGVWSDDDLALTEAQMTKSARYVDGPFRYERIEGASHWIPLDAPERLVDLLVDFFRQNGES